MDRSRTWVVESRPDLRLVSARQGLGVPHRHPHPHHSGRGCLFDRGQRWSRRPDFLSGEQQRKPGHAAGTCISTEAGWSKDLPGPTHLLDFAAAFRAGHARRRPLKTRSRVDRPSSDSHHRTHVLGSGRSPHASARPRLVGGFLRARPWVPRRARWGARHTARLRRDPRGDVRRPELGRGTRRFRARLRLADRRRRPRYTAPTRSIGSALPHT
jgi:hypothetical protein